jgi:hypothetical protein
MILNGLEVSSDGDAGRGLRPLKRLIYGIWECDKERTRLGSLLAA